MQKNNTSWPISRKQISCWSLFLINIQAWRPATLQKTPTRVVFSSQICEIFKTIYFEKHFVNECFWHNNLVLNHSIPLVSSYTL